MLRSGLISAFAGMLGEFPAAGMGWRDKATGVAGGGVQPRFMGWDGVYECRVIFSLTTVEQTLSIILRVRDGEQYSEYRNGGRSEGL